MPLIRAMIRDHPFPVVRNHYIDNLLAKPITAGGRTDLVGPILGWLGLEIGCQLRIEREDLKSQLVEGAVFREAENQFFECQRPSVRSGIGRRDRCFGAERRFCFRPLGRVNSRR